ncbi:MAG: Leptospira phage [Actinomycetota bacterium]|jgi:hypothetical protein
MTRLSGYAADTSVPVERSRAEIENVLKKYGCDAFVSGWSPDGAMIQFAYRGRSAKVAIPYPKEHSQAKLERAQRQRWRILLLLVKAQLESVRCGLQSFEEAFLPWMLLLDGSTVAETMIPQLPPAKERPRLEGRR